MSNAAPTTHCATPTGRTVALYGDEAPEYTLQELPAPAGSLDDIVELPDGSHAYLVDYAGTPALCRQMVARLAGALDDHAYNTRTAPEPLAGLIGEARIGASDRNYLRRSGRGLVGFAA
jgi:hypothetical protein